MVTSFSSSSFTPSWLKGSDIIAMTTELSLYCDNIKKGSDVFSKKTLLDICGLSLIFN